MVSFVTPTSDAALAPAADEVAGAAPLEAGAAALLPEGALFVHATSARHRNAINPVRILADLAIVSSFLDHRLPSNPAIPPRATPRTISNSRPCTAPGAAFANCLLTGSNNCWE